MLKLDICNPCITQNAIKILVDVRTLSMRIKGSKTSNKEAKDLTELATHRLPCTDYYLFIRKVLKSEWQKKKNTSRVKQKCSYIAIWEVTLMHID